MKSSKTAPPKELKIVDAGGQSQPWPRTMPTLTIPLSLYRNAFAFLALPVPITDVEWDQLVATLTAMRPGLVA